MKERDDNCHGCQWLDEGRKRGAGYCHMVERSAENQRLREWLSQHREEYELGRKELPSLKVRRPDMRRCELYEPGESTLAATTTIKTALYASVDSFGEFHAVEMTPQVPGQLGFDGSEAAPAPVLRIAK